MTSVTASLFTDSDLAGLLLAVGAEPPMGPALFDHSFAALGLGSRARGELAARIAERWGVDVEDQLEADTTPADVRRLVLRGLPDATYPRGSA